MSLRELDLPRPKSALVRLLAILGLCVLCWLVLNDWREREQTANAATLSHSLAETIATDLDDRISQIDTLASLLTSIQGQAPARSAAFEAYQLKNPGTLGLAMVTPDGGILSEGVQPDLTGITDDTLRLAKAAKLAQSSGKAHITRSMALHGAEHPVLNIVLPLTSAEAHGYSFTIILDATVWLTTILERNANLPGAGQRRVSISLEGENIYQSVGWVGATSDATFVSHTLHGNALEVGVNSTQGGNSAGPLLYIPEVITSALVLLLISLGMLERSLLTSRARNAHLKNNLIQARMLTESQQTEIERRRKAEQIAVEAAELKNCFIANMSHEIRTPVNAIIGMFELIQMSAIPDRQRRQAELGREAAERLFQQLSNVLELSQIESGMLQVTPEDLDTRQLAEVWTIAVEAMVRKSGRPLETAVWIDPAVPETISLDRLIINQIITNLIDNAVKYTPEGRVTVAMRIAGEPASGLSGQATEHSGSLLIEVCDTGIGIPDPEKAAVFKRYHRTTESRNHFEGGMGLGLNIVRELTDLAAINIEIHDTPGGGTIFRLVLPSSTLMAGVSGNRPRDAA